MLRWLLIAAASFLCGYFYAKFLTAHPLRMSFHLFVASLGLFAWIALLVASFGGIELLVASLLSVLLFCAGYALSARQVLGREDPRPVPELKRAKGDPGLGHTAVVYFTHGEPETYDPIGWINQFREFDEQKIRFVPFVARPFFRCQLCARSTSRWARATTA